MIQWLLHPMLFTWITLALYGANAFQFLIRGNFIGFGYWTAAACITIFASIGFRQ